MASTAAKPLSPAPWQGPGWSCGSFSVSGLPWLLAAGWAAAAGVGGGLLHVRRADSAPQTMLFAGTSIDKLGASTKPLSSALRKHHLASGQATGSTSCMAFGGKLKWPSAATRPQTSPRDAAEAWACLKMLREATCLKLCLAAAVFPSGRWMLMPASRNWLPSYRASKTTCQAHDYGPRREPCLAPWVWQHQRRKARRTAQRTGVGCGGFDARANK